MRSTALSRCMIAVLCLGFGAGIAHAAAATLPLRQAGLWRASTVVTLANGNKYHGGAPVVTVSCVDPATDLKFFTFEGSACASMTISGGGSAYEINGVCQDQGRPAKIHTKLNYVDTQTIELISSVTTTDGTVHMDGTMKFQGPCVAGMQPGDEGDIENGQFVKADNINDAGN